MVHSRTDQAGAATVHGTGRDDAEALPRAVRDRRLTPTRRTFRDRRGPHDLLRRLVAKLGTRCNREHPLPLRRRELVRRRVVGAMPFIVGVLRPALERPRSQTDGLAGGSATSTTGNSFFDERTNHLSFFSSVSSSTSPQMSWTFFWRTSSAAASANALSLRTSSRSSWRM